MAEAEYETVKDGLVRAIPEGVAEDHRDALRSRIRYGNQFSLRRRLTELLTRIPPVAMDVIAPDPGKFVSDLVESRNYYTHYDDQGKHLSWDELIAIMPHVRALVAVLFLQELGANPIKIAEVARQIVRG